MSVPGKIKRFVYGWAVGLIAYSSLLFFYNPKDHLIRVFYGGARGGHRGGPQVKVKLLQKIFPEYCRGYNVLYLCSGALYLPLFLLKRIKGYGVKIVLNQNGVFYPAWFPNHWEVENKRIADVMMLADYVFYQSDFCKASADKFLGVSAKNYEVLYNAVDTCDFIPDLDALYDWQGQDKAFVFLVSGNISHSTYYRLLHAIDCLSLARSEGLNIKIVFAGILSDELKQDLSQKISALNLDRYFILFGAYSRENAPKVFASADAYLMTKHNDPCPNVVLEAMSCGLPVLYSKSGGVPELVGEAGIGVEVEQTYESQPVPDVRITVSAMRDIILNCERYSCEARHRAETIFNIDHWSLRHREVFEGLISNKSLGEQYGR